MLSDPLTLTFSLVCLFYAIRGAYFGLTKVLLRISALAGAYLCAYTSYPPLSALLKQHIPIELPTPLYHALAGCLCLLIAFILFSAIAACIHSGIKKLAAKYPASLLTTTLTRLTAALVSCAFGFGLCVSGLLGYQILSKLFPVPQIEVTASNEAIINFGERLIQRIEAGDILINRPEEQQAAPKSTPSTESPSVKKSGGNSQSGGLNPTTSVKNAADDILLKQTIAPQQKQALEQHLEHLLSQEGQLTNFIRQNLPTEYQKDLGIASLLEQENAEQRIAQQFHHLLSDRQALMSALQSLKQLPLSPFNGAENPNLLNTDSPALVKSNSTP